MSQHGRFRFELATRSEDAQLRALLRETPMEGPVWVTFRREPSYFDAAAVEGPDCQVLTVRDVSTDRLVGMGVCSARTRYFERHPHAVGYLSGLRILPAYRSYSLLARGYRALREICRESSAECYLTTIADGNQRAVSVLTKGRAGLPHYQSLGRYYSFVLPLKPKRCRGSDGGLEVRPASSQDVGHIVQHLQQVGRQVNFFPRYEATDFFDANATFRNLRPEDILLALRDGQIVGTLGAWDQTAFRQIIVEHYPGLKNVVRPLYNVWSTCHGGPRFPAVGQPIRHLMAAIPLVKDGDSGAFVALLDEFRRRADRASHQALVVGAYELDPLLAILQAEAVFTYVTRVYLVHWADDREILLRARNHNVYLEVGCL
jgi:hypothetical protein